MQNWRSKLSLRRYLQNHTGICLLLNWQCIFSIFAISNSAVFLHSKNQNSYQGTLEIQELNPKWSMTNDQPRSFIGPYMVLQKDLLGFSRFCKTFLTFFKNTFFKSSEHHEPCLWSLFYFTKTQGTLMDVHGHPNGPLNGPWKANFSPPQSYHGPNWSFGWHTNLNLNSGLRSIRLFVPKK